MSRRHYAKVAGTIWLRQAVLPVNPVERHWDLIQILRASALTAAGVDFDLRPSVA